MPRRSATEGARGHRSGIESTAEEDDDGVNFLNTLNEAEWRALKLAINERSFAAGVRIPLGGGRTDLIANAIYKSYITASDLGTGAALCVLTTFAVIFTVMLFYAVRSLSNRVRAR